MSFGDSGIWAVDVGVARVVRISVIISGGGMRVLAYLG